MTNSDKQKLCMGCMSAMTNEGRCPHCGFQSRKSFSREFLPPRTELVGRYLVGNLQRHNGEGAFYIGYDLEEDLKVIISEYLPRTLANRNESDGSVTVKYGKEAQFKALLDDFIENARLIREVCQKATGIMPVLDIFTERGTAYVIYRYIQAVPLAEYLLENGGEISWAQAKSIIMPLLKSISALHQKGAIHRGISPETLLVDSKGKLWLTGLSVSALRTGYSELDCELFDGYSAPEQYTANGWQGTWTDVYAAGAILYRLLTGTLPVSAEIRKQKDSLYPANMLNHSIPENVSDAIDGAMLVAVEKRTQNIDKLIADLLETVDSNTAVFDAKDYIKTPSSTKTKRKMPFPLRVMLYTSVGLGAVIVIVYFTLIKPSISNSSESVSSSDIVTSDLTEESEPKDIGIPDFTGQFVQKVETNSEYKLKYEFKIEHKYNENDVPPGVIYNQSPSAGTPMLNKGTVILYVSKGSQITKMPFLIGSTLELALRTLESMNIYYDVITEEDETKDPGLVIKTSIEPGGDVAKEKDVVYIYVNKKPEESTESSEEINYQ
ncbi:serine/threonine-protein kinase [Hydrogenoanaerobacterium saccharovorans]|uniref:Serine/threonine protein kinase n=1 Tax=Hydrogenoanaerobacterium saccharovorans TaxID=474960 RepID=A0A1H7ZXI2_9FIRM|nr:PASTA domain-containing protein [Hydrogenoanaerobacterium saccharovorans]RPF48350.1 serine/threonine-protein kinase [Hydrogenoanaerobacterium saccharovorans]SEM62444.1 serine/threonine protein kinase [Hydrogenoanaerobacterium saccharovorans]